VGAGFKCVFIYTILLGSLTVVGQVIVHYVCYLLTVNFLRSVMLFVFIRVSPPPGWGVWGG